MNTLRASVGKIAVWLLAFLILSLIGLEKAEAENFIFRYIAVNPSATKTQDIQLKKYLPEEVKPKDVVDLGDLELEYDTEKSLYYVYTEVTLSPKELRVFEVEVEDIWLMPEDRLSQLEVQVDSILTHFETTQYYPQGKAIADTIYPRLNEIRTSQLDETASRQQHIGIYRQNIITLEAIKEDIARMEKILVTAGGPQAPQMLVDTRIQSDSPSRTMTWIVIFVIIIFLGLLGGVMFFTWQRQSTLTKESISESKKTAFPDVSGEDKETKEAQ